MNCFLDMKSGTSISALSQTLSDCVALGKLLTLSVFPSILKNENYTYGTEEVLCLVVN